MNPALKLLYNRKSLRAFADRKVSPEKVDLILGAVRRGPTAGNLCLYSVITVEDQDLKDTLARTCDNQPFIAKAPLVLLFLADYQRFYDYMAQSGASEYAEEKGLDFHTPNMGNLMLACQDTMVAAQTAVTAAESLGLGSCYIGDIMENYEEHRRLFDLPDYVFPLSLVVAGYSAGDYHLRRTGPRPAKETLFFTDRYRRLEGDELKSLYDPVIKRYNKNGTFSSGAANYGIDLFTRKYASDFAAEMNRSVRAALKVWQS
jgi:FMN reductase (NADPH)